MTQAVASHDALIRAAVAARHGRVVKSTGDGIYAVFEDPVDGLHAVITIQQELRAPAATAGLPLTVRCALHCGEAEVCGDDFFGRTLNLAARIMNAAYGGQVLVSHAIVERIADRLPTDIVLRDLGGVRLRGIATPARVYQVIHPMLRDDFPPLRSLEATPNNFPQRFTSFIGREQEVLELDSLLESTPPSYAVRNGRVGQDPAITADWHTSDGPVRRRRVGLSTLLRSATLRSSPARSPRPSACAKSRNVR